MTSHRTKMPERLWVPIQTYAADGGTRPNSGGAPFRQPSPAYPSAIGRKAPQEYFSEESFRNYGSVRKRVSRKLIRELRTQKRQRTASLGDLAEPIYYSKRVRTSSTRVFASQNRAPEPEQFLNLIYPGPPGSMELARGACRFRVEPLDYRFPNSLGFAIHSGFRNCCRSQSFVLQFCFPAI